MDTVRFGIIGMGNRGRRGWIHTLNLVGRAEVAAVAEPIEPLRLEGARLAGIAPEDAYTDAAPLLDRRDVDAVVVAVAPEHQADIVVAALEAGKHVICEVPLAYTLEDCWRIILAAERTGGLLSFGSQRSYSPFVRAWRALLEDGALGKVLYAECQYLHGMTLDRYWQDARTGARLTWEQAQGNPHARKTRIWQIRHPITYSTPGLGPILQVLDEPVRRVTCFATRRPSYYLEGVPNPDIEVALMETAGGTIIRVACGFIAPTPEPYHYWHLLGTLGEVETGRRATSTGAPDGGLMWQANRYTRGRSEVHWTFTPHEPSLQQAGASGHEGLDLYPAHALVEGILDNRPIPVDVYRAAEIDGASIVAAESAEQRGAPLPVPDFRPGPQRLAGRAPPVAPLVEAVR